jgi:hypothetical protein
MPEKSTPIEESSIGELLSSLHKVYEGRDKLAEFEEESSIFRELIPKLADTFLKTTSYIYKYLNPNPNFIQ